VAPPSRLCKPESYFFDGALEPAANPLDSDLRDLRVAYVVRAWQCWGRRLCAKRSCRSSGPVFWVFPASCARTAARSERPAANTKSPTVFIGESLSRVSPPKQTGDYAYSSPHRTMYIVLRCSSSGVFKHKCASGPGSEFGLLRDGLINGLNQNIR
jgi:hypothetical protein